MLGKHVKPMGSPVTPVATPLSLSPPPDRVLRRVLPVTLAMVMVLGAGIVHGRWTQRWTVSHAIEDAAVRLRRLPMILGDWQGEIVVLDRQQLIVGGIAGYIARRYENHLTKETITILVVCGPPGPISVHTPDICYSGAGFEMVRPAEICTLPPSTQGRPGTFWEGLLRKPSVPLPIDLRILWSWSSSAAGPWEAPENPRLRFASNEVLHKLYVIRQTEAFNKQTEDDPSLTFLQLLLPELARIREPEASESGD